MSLEPARPVLASAVSTGALSAENTDIVIRCLDTLNRIPTISAEQLDRAEHDLTSHAGVLRPEDLKAAATKTVECYHPDGQDERDRKNDALRELRLVTHRDGVVLDRRPAHRHRRRPALRAAVTTRPPTPRRRDQQATDPGRMLGDMRMSPGIWPGVDPGRMSPDRVSGAEIR